jgi:hypothetical protein
MKRRHRRQRSGTAIVESAMIVSVLALLLIGMLEMSLMLMNHTSMAEGARRIARAAIVHGDRCSSMGPWGPADVSIQGDAAHPAAEVLREILFTLPPADVQIDIRWLDGDNNAGDRVRVTVQHMHQPIVPAWGWNTGLTLRGSSTMQIAH